MKKEYIMGITFLLFLASFLIDKEITLFLNNIKVNFIHNFLIFVSSLSEWYFILIAISLLFFLKKREFLLPFWISFFITGLISVFLKYLINRPRPFEILNLNIVHTFSSWNTSFPSWHTASVFVVLPFLFLSFPKLKWFWICFCFLVAFSRTYIGVHYLSDIFGGIILGLGISYIVIFLKKKLKW